MEAGAERAVSPSKSRQAYDWIKERIAQQDFTPGYRLVLGSIATELDMSVVPVREAVRRLQAEGLVTYERNVGARVAMTDDSQYRHSMQVLGIMESTATALSARRLEAGDIARAREVNERMATLLPTSSASFEPRLFTNLNHEFHEILFSRCTNPRMLELVQSEWSRLAHTRHSTFSFVPERAQESVTEHEEILQLIERGAPLPEIETACRAHRSATLNAYLTHEHPEEVLETPVFTPSRPTGGTE